MAYTDILYGVDNLIATITLNRPDKLNAWTSEMDREVRHAVEAAAADGNVRAIVLTGAGRGFCAGADMSRLSKVAAEGRPSGNGSQQGRNSGNFAQKFSYLLAVPKPIFAAINGPIAGIAVCLVLFCDFRYMAEGARLTTAFAKRGLIAEHGSSWMLPRLIGPMNALDLLYSARMVEAAEAERLGLVRQLPVTISWRAYRASPTIWSRRRRRARSASSSGRCSNPISSLSPRRGKPPTSK